MRLIHTVYEPAGDGPHPTLIAMHGFGASALDLLGLAPYIADGRFMVICPQGPMEVPIGPTRGYAWFPIRMGASPDRTAIDDANRMVTEFLNTALQKYPVDRKKLVVLGFSQGGMMAMHVGLRRPRAPAAIVSYSGMLIGGEHLAEAKARNARGEPPPILLVHGDQDAMIPFEAMFVAGNEFAAAEIPSQWHLSMGVGHGIDAGALRHGGLFLAKAFGISVR